MLVHWVEAYKIGIPSIDEEHEHLFGIVNGLHEAIAAGSGAEIISKILGDLLDYSGYHFSHEESYMLSRKVPGYAAHRMSHDTFITKLGKFVFDYEQGRISVGKDTLDFLQDWVTQHVQGVDREMAKGGV